MDLIAHSSHSYILYNLTYFIIWNTISPPIFSFIAIIFGIFPDFDVIYHHLKGKNSRDNSFQHHLYYWTHVPLSYIPLVILFIISVIIKFHVEIFLIPLIGILSHLLSDSACCGDGMMWSKIPWKKGQFGVFYNFFSKNTDGYHGNYWIVRWRKTLMFKLAFIEISLIILFNIWYQTNFGIDWASIIIVIFIVIIIIYETRRIDSKYHKEPPNGRYYDYRKNSCYLAWMQKKNLVFDSKMHVVKNLKSNPEKYIN